MSADHGEAVPAFTAEQKSELFTRIDEAVVKFKREHKLLLPKVEHAIVLTEMDW